MPDMPLSPLLQNSIDFAPIGGGSKVAAILLTYPYQVNFILIVISLELSTVLFSY
jgi:hypothetical protein